MTQAECRHLLKHGHFELPDIDATRASACLASGTTFGFAVAHCLPLSSRTARASTDARGSMTPTAIPEA